MSDSKPMLGGCFVCQDERGWANNPLVYCDGKQCSVAVHQACYGIVSVPKGPWFCKTCEAGKHTKDTRCCLCPYKGGAFKSAESNNWAHVICALYIPEVEFQNVSTMEPILANKVPADKFALSCYICKDDKDPRYAMSGACITCSKSGCKLSFHVTCGQIRGLLCEIAGVSNTTKYCGFCEQHVLKSKKRIIFSKETCSRVYSLSSIDELYLDKFQLYRMPELSHSSYQQKDMLMDKQYLKTEIRSTNTDNKINKNLQHLNFKDNVALTYSNELPSRLPTQLPFYNSNKTISNFPQENANKGSKKKLVSKNQARSKLLDKPKTAKKSSKLNKNKRSKVKQIPKTLKSVYSPNHGSNQASSSQNNFESLNITNQVGFALAPKHSFVSLANFGENSMQASELNSIGHLKPTPQTKSNERDLIADVNNIFQKQKDDYWKFVTKDMKPEICNMLKSCLELEKANEKRQEFLYRLFQLNEQFSSLRERYVEGL